MQIILVRTEAFCPVCAYVPDSFLLFVCLPAKSISTSVECMQTIQRVPTHFDFLRLFISK